MNFARYLLVILALSLMALASVAQDEKKADKKRPFAGGLGEQNQLLPQELLDKLNLNEEQKAKIAKIRKDFEEKNKEAIDKAKEAMAKVRETAEKARQDKDKEAFKKIGEQMREAGEQFQKLRKDLEGQLAGVLNDEQKKKLEESKRDGGKPGLPFRPGERPGTKGPPGQPGFIPPALQERLKLSDEQKEKLKQLQKEFEDKSKSVLTDEQKKQLEEFQKDGPRKRPEK